MWTVCLTFSILPLTTAETSTFPAALKRNGGKFLTSKIGKLISPFFWVQSNRKLEYFSKLSDTILMMKLPKMPWKSISKCGLIVIRWRRILYLCCIACIDSYLKDMSCRILCPLRCLWSWSRLSFFWKVTPLWWVGLGLSWIAQIRNRLIRTTNFRFSRYHEPSVALNN